LGREPRRALHAGRCVSPHHRQPQCALLLTLNAGASYTVQVDGIGGTTGEALIEIYEVF
jgi:hypothetical protein